MFLELTLVNNSFVYVSLNHISAVEPITRSVIIDSGEQYELKPKCYDKVIRELGIV